MKKVRMTITVSDRFEVSTNFHGTSEELVKCKKALARHFRDQAKASALAASAEKYLDERPALEPEPKPATPRRYA